MYKFDKNETVTIIELIVANKMILKLKLSIILLLLMNTNINLYIIL